MRQSQIKPPPLGSDAPSPGFRAAQRRMLLATMFCYLFYYTGRQNLGFAMPGIREELGIGEDVIGWLGTALLWSYAIGQAVNGNLGDAYGGRRMMSLGAIVSCALNWVTSFGQSFWGLLIPWGANGYAQSLGWAPGSRLLSNWWPRQQRGTAFGCYLFAAGFSAVLTYGLCILVLTYLPWQWVFRLPVLLMLVGGLVYYLVARDRPEDLGYPPISDDCTIDERVVEDESAAQRYAHVLTDRPFLLACVAIGFQSMARYGLLLWVPNHYLGEGWKENPGNAWISLALPIGMALGALTGGKICDRWFQSNRSRTIAIFMTLSMVMSLAMYAVPIEQRLAGMMLLFLAGFFVYAPQASFWPLCPDMLGLRRAGTGVGIMDTSAYSFAGLGMPLIGWVIKTTGQSAAAFAIVAVVSLLCAICILPVRR